MAKAYDPKTREVIEVGSSFETGLNPELIAGKTLVPDTTSLGVISASSLNPVTPINVPPPPTSLPIDLTGGQATIDSLNKLLAQDIAPASAPASLEAMFNKLLPTSGVPEAQADVLTKQTSSKAARDRLAAINAQLAGISAETQATPLRLQEEATGRGVTKAGLAPLEAGELRKIALRALPLQAQALAAQAEVAAAQGDVELSQQTLAMAQDKLKTIFGLVSQDVENKYNYFKDLRDKAFQIADKNQQQKFAAVQKEDDRKFTNWQNIINDAQTKASALMSTQPDLMAKITARVGQSTGFNDTNLGADVAKIMEGVVQTVKTGDIGEFKAFFPNVDITTPAGQQQFLNWKARVGVAGRVGEVTFTDIDLASYAQQYASTGKIPTGIPKGKFGEVAEAAKEMPKQKGAVIDVNTGVKPDISDARIDGLAALYDITLKTQQLKELDKLRIRGITSGTLGKIFGSEAQQRYIDLRTEIIDLLARARTGAALTASEEKFYSNQLPSRFAKPLFLGVDTQSKIDNFSSKIQGTLDTKLKANSTSIVGFSKVKLGGKEYKVGDIIEINGKKGRILADGSIAEI